MCHICVSEVLLTTSGTDLNSIFMKLHALLGIACGSNVLFVPCNCTFMQTCRSANNKQLSIAMVSRTVKHSKYRGLTHHFTCCGYTYTHTIHECSNHFNKVIFLLHVCSCNCTFCSCISRHYNKSVTF